MRSIQIIVSSMMLLFAGSALADTYIFITNSTPDPVTISVHHHGTRTLSQGSQWAQETTSIPPYETRRVLRFNRYWGVKRGHTFNFDTHVSNGQSSAVMQQTMVGTWSGSNIRHSARAADFNAPWYSDRNIHRHATQYDNRSSQVAFKAEFTGGYDDFYYTIHNNTETESLSGTEQLKVLSYNIYALPFVASKIGDRLAEIHHHVQGYDALILQEVFDSARNELLNALAQEYPYQTHIPRVSIWSNTNFNVFDSGVVILSRYPIVNVADYIYPDCSGTDCMADKGIIYAEIIKHGKAYHIANTHTASFDTDEARALRQVQFQQMRNLVNAQQAPAFDAVLFGGDFNVNKLKWPADYAQMLVNLNATDPVSTGHDATFDPRINTLSQAYGSGGDTVEYLDYVVFANDHRQPADARNDVRVPRSTAQGLWGVWDLSDHFPVMGEFDF